MLSTRLSWPGFSSNGKTQATNHCLICKCLILVSQPTRTSPDISAPLDPISLWALAWSDVSVQHLVPKLGESTILRLRSESYSIVASYNGEPDLRAVFMLGVLTYLFYLLSKPNIPRRNALVAMTHKQIASAKVLYFSGLCKFFNLFCTFSVRFSYLHR